MRLSLNLLSWGLVKRGYPMNEKTTLARIDSLEERYAHQEAALDEITRRAIEQGGLIEAQAEKIERLEAALRALDQSSYTVATDERPPHY